MFDPAPFTDGVGCVDFLHGQMQRRKDFMFCSHGGEGTGKSTTTDNVLRALSKRHGYTYSERSSRIFDFPHLLDVLAEGKTCQIYNLDEAINIFHNQDWSTWQAKQLTKVIRQMRIMSSIWALNVPDFEGLHPYLRDYRIPLRFYHPPVWESDGLGNGPSRMLWKHERFDYKEQRVTHRWEDVGSFHAHNLDDDPGRKEYDQQKRDNFLRLVKDIQKRQAKEDKKGQGTKTRPRAKKNAANGHEPPPTPTTT